MILEEQILEGSCNQMRIIDVKSIEVDTEETIEMIIMKEGEVGQGIDNIPIIPEGMIEVIVGIGQFQELVSIEIELDAI